MKPLRLMLLAFIAGSLLTGCAGTLPITVGGDCHNKTLPMLLDATDMKTLFHDMALELCTDKCADRQTCGAPASCQEEPGGRATVMVTDFADLQSLVPSQSGMLMGELMRGGLNSVCCYKIVQAEFAKYFKLSENGLVVLTRRATEVKKNEYQQPEAVVGTYTYLSNDKVLIFARRMDTETGTISKMVTRELTYSCGGSSVINYTVK
ncbi:hypothetical protein KP004_14185 [Geomonas oryzisoli]|uniref:FlgO domain-containing protein n=1 Tax=Geomonas oryzisoli TaxID=2847992 RepID=A0ABX8J3I5_9BACT|nr:FlgO family outer membrane protein [Geomonas oryzisoli]QWV92353.1 hypothetical protein KP004_14185 [Geomonas oryzisoli]